MVFGSARKTHFENAHRSLTDAETAVRTFEYPDPTTGRARPKRLSGECEPYFHRLATVHERLTRAVTDLARSGKVQNMSAEDRSEFFTIKRHIGYISARYEAARNNFVRSCLKKRV